VIKTCNSVNVINLINLQPDTPDSQVSSRCRLHCKHIYSIYSTELQSWCQTIGAACGQHVAQGNISIIMVTISTNCCHVQTRILQYSVFSSIVIKCGHTHHTHIHTTHTSHHTHIHTHHTTRARAHTRAHAHVTRMAKCLR
jgi:hypothetical protein